MTSEPWDWLDKATTPDTCAICAHPLRIFESGPQHFVLNEYGDCGTLITIEDFMAKCCCENPIPSWKSLTQKLSQ